MKRERIDQEPSASPIKYSEILTEDDQDHCLGGGPASVNGRGFNRLSAVVSTITIIVTLLFGAKRNKSLQKEDSEQQNNLCFPHLCLTERRASTTAQSEEAIKSTGKLPFITVQFGGE